MIVLIDNYDSFVHNLARYFVLLGQKTHIFRNDAISLQEITAINPSSIVISPGPCTPNEAGISLELVQYFAGKIPILGICLGHQVIANAFGGTITTAKQPLHGSASSIWHDQQGVFKHLNNPLNVGRYHSLVVAPESVPPCFKVTAKSKQGEIMAIKHKTMELVGLQFHPESILTNSGKKILANYITSVR